MRRPKDFAVTVRNGRRAAAPGLVVHLHMTSADLPARAGFVVGRSVGTSVVRNRVRRQLRHLLAAPLDELPAGSSLVVRVLPRAAAMSRRDLATALTSLLDRVQRPAAT